MMADTPAKPYGDVEYADPGYLDADGNQASKSGKKGQKRYPLTADKVMAAWSYINQAKNAAQYTPEQLSAIKGRIKTAMKKQGHDVTDMSRAEVLGEDAAPSPLQVFGSRMITRAYELEDIHIKPGTGRSVEAYATVFNTEAEIMDPEGHYLEVNDPHAFDRHLQRMGGVFRVGVFYNHGKTLHGKSSEAGSVPLGRPELIRADSRGLLTVTEYNKTQLADDILEAIKSGSITAQSYTGPVFKSTPSLSRSQRRRGGYQPNPDGTLQTVRRMELGIFEYGPTPIPAYEDAAVVGVRAQQYFSDEDQDDVPDESDPVSATVEADPFRRRLHAAMRARGL